MKYEADLKRAVARKQENFFALREMGQKRPKDLDDRFHQLHDKVFEEIDCLECANCCKTTSPIFLNSDIERLAKHLKMKVKVFIESYLHIDEDQDYVLNFSPCTFLGPDNKCMVYNDRPKACREYPHTNRKRMYQITKLTFKNTLICPAVSRILDRLTAQ